MARAFKEVLVRDPTFDMVTFLGRLRADVPTIVGAYLNGKSDVLAEHCAPQMVEQLTAIIRAQQTQVRDAWVYCRGTELWNPVEPWGWCSRVLRAP